MTNEAFWQEKWDSNQIAFHEAQANPLLVNNFGSLSLKPGARVFLPLCGKTLDIDWLLGQGIYVLGIEFSEVAIRSVFERLEQDPRITELTGGLTQFSTTGLDLFQGDFFNLTTQMLGGVDAVYDRAALVAMPGDMRPAYCAHLKKLSALAPQLLVTLDYAPGQIDGPPFSVSPAEVETLYESAYRIEPLRDAPISGALAERCRGHERLWHLEPDGGAL